MPRLLDYAKKLVVVLADLVFLSVLYGIIESRNGVTFHGYPLWIGLTAISLLIAMVVLEKGITFNLYVGLCALLILAAGGGIQLYLDFAVPSLGSRVFFMILSVVPIIHVFYIAYEEVSRKDLLTYFDGGILVSCIVVGTMGTAYSGFGRTGMVLTLVVTFALLLVLMAMRLETNYEEGVGKKIAGAAVALALLVLVALFVLAISGGLEDVTTDFVNGLVSVVKAVYHFVIWLLVTIVDWISSLFPDAYGLPPEDFDTELHWVLEESGAREGNPVLAISLTTILVLGAIAFVIWRFWGIKLQRKKRVKAKRKLRRKSHVGSGLKRLFLKLWVNLVFQVQYLFHRNSPTGLLLWTEHSFVLKGRRKKAETPTSYLRRISSPDTRLYTEELSRILERQYYSGKKEKLPAGFAKRYKVAMKQKQTSGTAT